MPPLPLPHITPKHNKFCTWKKLKICKKWVSQPWRRVLLQCKMKFESKKLWSLWHHSFAQPSPLVTLSHLFIQNASPWRVTYFLHGPYTDRCAILNFIDNQAEMMAAILVCIWKQWRKDFRCTGNKYLGEPRASLLSGASLCRVPRSASSLALPGALLCREPRSAGSLALSRASLCREVWSAGSLDLPGASLYREPRSAWSLALRGASLFQELRSAGSIDLPGASICREPRYIL